MDETIQSITNIFGKHPWLDAAIWTVVLIILSLIVNFVVRKALIRIFHKISGLFLAKSDDIDRTIRYITNIAPALVFSTGVKIIPAFPDTLSNIIENVANAFIIFTIVLAISSMLSVFNRLYELRSGNNLKPIKGFVQIIKIGLFSIATILILATLIDRSPVILFSGLGAMAAVLMLIFQDTLLSLVAGVQITSTDMVRVGDWIEMPSLTIDGDVVEISLYTIKVRNFDNTINTIPIRKLVSDSFKNWRGMQESGGRRIKRSIFIDQSTIDFLTPKQIEKLSKINHLKDYFDQKNKEIAEYNKKIHENGDIAINQRRLTNLGTFRIYAMEYLKNNPNIRQDMRLIVRQLAPSINGLPLEIYCFANSVISNEYENIQSDIFDHLYSIIEDFHLKIFQNPSGNDYQTATPATTEEQEV